MENNKGRKGGVLITARINRLLRRGNPSVVLTMFMITMLFHGCWGSSSSNENSVKIGALLPLTGQLASSSGQAIKTGIEHGIESVNRYTELNKSGYYLEVETVDTAGNPATALEKLREMSEKGIRIFIGPASSEECAAVVDYANRNNLVLISPSSTDAGLAINDNLIRLVTDDRLQAKALAALMANQTKTVMIPVYRDDAWGRGLSALQAEYFTGYGGSIIEGISYNPASSPEKAVAELALKVEEATRNTDPEKICIVIDSFSEGADILRYASAYQALSSVMWYGSDGLAMNPSITGNPEASAFAEKTGLACPVFSREDGVVPTPFVVIPDKSLREKIEISLGRKADNSAFSAWDAAWLTALTLKETGRNFSAEKFIKTMADTGKSRLGLSGRLVLNDYGDLKFGNYGFYKVTEKQGKPSWQLFAAYQCEDSTPELVYVPETTLPGMVSPAEKITMTAILDLSGDNSETGLDCKAGLENALAGFNSYLEANSYNIRFSLDIMDSKGLPEKAAELLYQIPADRPKFVIGPVSSSEAELMKPIADRLGMILVSPSATAPSLAIPDDSLYRFVPNDNIQGKAIARIMNRDGIKSASMLVRDDLWGRELARVIMNEMGETGIASKGIFYCNTDGSNLESAVSGLASNPENASSDPSSNAVIMLATDESESILDIASKIPELKTFRWYGADGTALRKPLIANNIARNFAAQTGLTCSGYAIKVGGHGFRPESIPWEAVNSEIRQCRGDEFSAYADTSWDAFWISALAFISSEWSEDPTRLSLALTETSGKYIGMSNYMTLDENGDRRYGDYGFYQVISGDSSPGKWSLRATYHFHPGMLPWNITIP